VVARIQVTTYSNKSQE